MKINNPLILLTIISSLTAFSVSGIAATPTAECVISSEGQPVSKIYEGQPIDMQVVLNDADPVEPEIAPDSDFQVSFVTDQSLNTTRISIINNHRIDNSQKKHVFVYKLVPQKTGVLTIPTVSFNIKGQVVAVPEKQIEVLPAQKQDYIRMKILVTSKNKPIGDNPIYPMQSFDVTLRVQVKAFPEPYSNQNPLSALDTPPRLQIPWASETLPDGIKSNSDVNSWLSPYSSQHGFSINDYQKQMSAFDLMGDFGFGSRIKPQLYAFLPAEKKVTLPDAQGVDTLYYQFDFTRRFTAVRTGTYSFGPVNFKGVLGVKVEDNKLIGEGIYASTPAAEVTVSPPPILGRPQNYVNAVGLFEMTANLVPTKTRVGEPMTLTLTIRGDGAIEDITAPKLEQIKEIKEHFKIYDATDKIEDRQVQFTWSLRPLDDTVKEFPAISASYFDVDSGQYYQMKTPPIPITVSKSTALQMDTISAGGTGNSADQSWKNQQGGVHANITNINALRESRFNLIESKKLFLWINGTIYTIFIILCGTILLLNQFRLDPVQSRRYFARSKALSEIHKSTALSSEIEKLEKASKIIAVYAADRMNVPAAGLTPEDVLRLLRQDGVKDPQTIKSVEQLLQSADAARYCGMAGNTQNSLIQAEKLIRSF